mgnify:CR=1 FL=1
MIFLSKKLWELQKRFLPFTDEIKKITDDCVRDTYEATKEYFIKQIKEGKICLSCGANKENDLLDICIKCLENE